MEKKYRVIVSWVFVVTWMGVIFYLSHQPAAQSSQLSGGIVEAVLGTIEKVVPPSVINKETFHYLLRKGAHFTAYFILACFTVHALRAGRRLTVTHGLIALLISVVYAITDEVHQLFIPGRSGEVTDVLIDGAGALTGLLIYGGLYYLLNRQKR